MKVFLFNHHFREHLHPIGPGQSLGFTDLGLLYAATDYSFISCAEGQERKLK